MHEAVPLISLSRTKVSQNRILRTGSDSFPSRGSSSLCETSNCAKVTFINLFHVMLSNPHAKNGTTINETDWIARLPNKWYTGDTANVGLLFGQIAR